MEYSIIEDQWGSGQAVVFLLLRFSSQFTRTPLPPDMFYNQQWFWVVMGVVAIVLALLVFCCCCWFCWWWLRSDRDGLESSRSGLKLGHAQCICENLKCCKKRRWEPPVLPLHYRSFLRPDYIEPILPTFTPPRRPLPPLLPAPSNSDLLCHQPHHRHQ